jgi:hypothetical protein
MLTIPGHKGNANQNHTMFPLIPVSITTIKNTNNKNVGEEVGKKKLSYTAGGNIN